MSVAPLPGRQWGSAPAAPSDEPENDGGPKGSSPLAKGRTAGRDKALPKSFEEDGGRMRTGHNSDVDSADTGTARKRKPKRQPERAPASPARETAERRGNPGGERRGGTRAEEVRAILEEDIFTGRLRPGTRMDEESLAQRFNISRTPIREALMQLVHVGLVEKQPRHGAVVAPLKLHRMVQMFEVMSEIEGLCARYAARRMSEEERQNLREMHEESRLLVEARDLDRYYALNRSLHELIRAGSHNEPLQEIAHGLSTRLAPYRRFQLNHPSRLTDSYEEHVTLIAAILAADPEAAYNAMRRHVTIQIDIFAEFVSIMGGNAAD